MDNTELTRPTGGSVGDDPNFQEFLASWHEEVETRKYPEARVIYDALVAYIDALLAARAAPGVPVPDYDSLRRTIHELRTYSPAGDAYHGAYVHKAWANLIEAAIACPAPAAPIDRDSAFMRAAMDFAQAHIHCDEIESEYEADPAGGSEADAAEVDGMYNVTKKRMVEAYRALLPVAVQQPTDLVRRLRNIASEDVSPYFCTNVPKDDLRAAAEEIERLSAALPVAERQESTAPATAGKQEDGHA